ncbi:cellulase family glycosylhydrolase [Vibrio gangliei]|uniref:cellulase family glycosylhydrolase n=1 Tax=Vibrio gangliei TaxID=2077090 RepID=UPI000D013F84|nr:cellulase family glycosylhydrolase [Vibrio gangliei]
MKMNPMLMTLPLAFVLNACQNTPAEKPQTVEHFINQNGTQLYNGDQPYRIAGTNNYYLHYQSNEMIDSVLDDAQAMGLNTIRMWGFMDGISHNHTMQPSPGVYTPPPGVQSALERLDYTVAEAKKRGLRLVIVLTNNWGDFGGMSEYVKWFNGENHDDFYRSEKIKSTYKNYVKHLVEHTNRYTQVPNNQEPTIMTWELANEPRAQSDKSGELLYQWAKEMSDYVRTLAPKQLIALGSEGFFKRPNTDDWTYNGNEGVDWERIITLPNINYGTFHLYPEHWKKLNSEQWGTQWIVDHAQAAKKANKPAVLEEYGIGKDEPLNRDFIYRKWTNTAYEQGLAGSMFWILSGIEPGQADGLYPDYDGFRILNDGGSTAQLLMEHSQQMRGIEFPQQNHVYITYPIDGMKVSDEHIKVSAYSFNHQDDNLIKMELRLPDLNLVIPMTDPEGDGYYEARVKRDDLGLGEKTLIAMASYQKGPKETYKIHVEVDRPITGYALGTHFDFDSQSMQGWEKDGTWQAEWKNPALEISSDLGSPMLKLNLSWSGNNDWEEVKIRNMAVKALNTHTHMQYDLYIPVQEVNAGGVRPYAALGDGWVKLDTDRNRVALSDLPIVTMKEKQYYKQTVKIELGDISNKLPDLFLCIVGDKLALDGAVYIDNIQLFKPTFD